MTAQAIFVSGVGLWATGASSVAAWLKPERDAALVKPACEVVDARLRRATSHLTRAAMEASAEACTSAGLSPKQSLPIVFGSAAGEIQIAIEQLEMMRSADGIVSPARFRNSVHNTATGIYSIATGSTGFATAIAASEITAAMSLLEVSALLHAGAERVLCVVGDESLPVPLDRFGRHETLAVALVCEREASPRTKAVLSHLAPCTHEPRCSRDKTSSKCAAPLAELVRVVAQAERVQVGLGETSGFDREAWCAQVTCTPGGA